MGFRDARLAADMSGAEVAEVLGISRQAVNHWEIGKAMPEADKLLKLAALYNCRVEDLLIGNPNKEAVQ